MSEKKYSANDPERTLITLDQLSQTIEVMTSVVNRLRQHLSEQISVRKEIEARDQAREEEDSAHEEVLKPAARERKPSAVVEVSKPEPEREESPDQKTLH